MTPFGEKLRALRASKGITQAQFAKAMDVSPAYISALEHGRKGAPPWPLVQKVIQYFELIWDAAEEIENLARLSRPKVTIDTAGLDAKATTLVNQFARVLPQLDDVGLEGVADSITEAQSDSIARRRSDK